MSNIARVGDVAGGVILTGASSVFINGVPVARLGEVIQSHGDSPHNSAVIVTSSSKVFSEGIGVARVGDVASCSDSITSGSSNTFAG